MQGSANNLRRRKAEKVGKKQTKNTETTEPTRAPSASDNTLHYYLLQYGGAVLGATSCVGTMAMYEQDDPYMVAKMIGWMGLAFVGMLLHEFRPYQRPLH